MARALSPHLTSAALAQALREAVRSSGIEQARDHWNQRLPPAHFPSVDLAVIAFPRDGAPVWANVLFSRELPQGHVVQIGPEAGPARGVRFDADLRDDELNSPAWMPGADWQRLRFAPLAGDGPLRFVAPYPASLVKLMVAVGVGRLVDAAQARWEQPWTHAGRSRTVAQWTESMLVASSNEATDAMVALLHAGGLITRHDDGSETNGLHVLFRDAALPTLRLAQTRSDGGWRNAQGAGVGQLQMTAWDTVRLLWLLLPEGVVPAPPWRPPGARPLLSERSRERLWAMLYDQGLHEVLSSTALAGLPGWQPGLPARLPARWLRPDGSVEVDDVRFPADVRPANARATASFAHKTGTTDNYASDAGWVQGDGPHGRRYLVAMITSVGRRYAAHPACATDWSLPRIGKAVDAWLQAAME